MSIGILDSALENGNALAASGLQSKVQVADAAVTYEFAGQIAGSSAEVLSNNLASAWETRDSA